MIEPNKSRGFESLFSLYNERLLRKGFHRIQVRRSPGLDLLKPTLYISNHCSWWDGLIAFQINRVLLRQQMFVMMSEEGLRRFRFFRRLGAFSVNRSSTADIRRSLDYSLEVLQVPGQSLWLFPQGDILHQEVRPLGFLPGCGFLLGRLVPLQVQVVPVTLHYTFLLDQRPEVFAELGRPLELADAAGAEASADRRRGVRLARLAEDRVTRQLDALRAEVIGGQPAGFSLLLQGASSTSDRFARFFRRT